MDSYLDPTLNRLQHGGRKGLKKGERINSLGTDPVSGLQHDASDRKHEGLGSGEGCLDEHQRARLEES